MLHSVIVAGDFISIVVTERSRGFNGIFFFELVLYLSGALMFITALASAFFLGKAIIDGMRGITIAIIDSCLTIVQVAILLSTVC